MASSGSHVTAIRRCGALSTKDRIEEEYPREELGRDTVTVAVIVLFIVRLLRTVGLLGHNGPNICMIIFHQPKQPTTLPPLLLTGQAFLLLMLLLLSKG